MTEKSKNKRIRHPKKKEQEQKEEQNKEQKKHFTLDVHDSTVFTSNSFGK